MRAVLRVRFRFMAVTLIALVASLITLATGCDQLNKPIGHPSGSSSSGSPPSTTSGDGGAADHDGSGAPAPSITAQPGDIQI